MNHVFIGLGSNIEPRIHHLESALSRLEQHEEITMLAKSSIYETAPVGFTGQGHFLNMVIEVETTLSGLDLLRYCQQIEINLGRQRTIKNGPRTIDLDILLYNQEEINVENLTIPHPRLHERAFVLVPFAEIAPKTTLPTTGLTMKELLEKLSEQELNEVVKWTDC